MKLENIARSHRGEGFSVKIKETRIVEVKGIGEKINKARLASSKSIEKLCGEVGISRSYWYDIEKEIVRGSLSYENLKKIEKALEIDLGVKFDS